VIATRPRVRRRRYALAHNRPTAPPTITLAEAIELHLLALRASNRSPNTLQSYGYVERSFLAFVRERMSPMGDTVPLEALSVENARAWQLHLTMRGLAPASVAQKVGILKAWARFLEDEGMVEDNLLRKLRRPKMPQTIITPFSDEQLAAILQAAAGGPEAARNVAMFFLLLDSGLRGSELCGLRPGDLDLVNGTARVFGKGAKERLVQFGPTTATLIGKYVAERTVDTPWLFVSHSGRQLNGDRLREITKKWGHRAGVTGVRCSPHDWRHTFAVRFLVTNPGALFHLAALMGHTKLEVTQIYARITESNRRLPGLSVADGIGLGRLLPREEG
jgi:integrase/recombinase XerC